MIIVVRQKVYVARCGVYGVDIQIVDRETGEIYEEYTKEYARAKVKGAANKSMDYALDQAYLRYRPDVVFVESNCDKELKEKYRAMKECNV